MSYFDKGKNQKARFDFVIQWANFVRSHPDEEWSRQQKVLIDSQVRGAKKSLLSRKEYLAIKDQVQKL
ncbi:MAG TPA: hypothetical protein VJG90_00645 [Candidatus Nanoarchaeia archaeon]|nr:hypothetical protein [Candidatus Nanoarchaeia archaeon]